MPDEAEKPDAPAEPDVPPIAEADPDLLAYGRYRGAMKDETVGELKARRLAQLARGRTKSAETRRRKKKEREQKEEQKALRAMKKRLTEAAALQHASAQKGARRVGEVDLVADILWVYENIGNKSSEWVGAPGKGALGLLKWAKENQDKFYDKMVVRALATQEAREREVREKEQGEAAEEEASKKKNKVVDLPLAEVERMLRGFAGETSG